MLTADTIIFAAGEPGALDHTRAALRLLKRGGYEGTKQFLLLSSVMTSRLFNTHPNESNKGIH